MSCKQDQHSAKVLASKPSVSFSTVSAGSATSAASSRSGGSRLLFGEIDTSSDRSSKSYASVCSFVQCDSSTFLKFWLEDKCRDRFLSHVAKSDLSSLRLTCHDFSVRAAPTLFNDLSITFRTSTFTKPARLAALDRLGFYVKTLTFNVPHSSDTFLPPLVDPDTGAELSFTYTPQIEAPTSSHPKYGDLGTTEILTRQWPARFHAATNVPAFIRAFSSFVNLSQLKVSCPGYDPAQQHRRSTVDFALISLRIAIERNNLNALETLAISPIHPGGILYLSPLHGYGATPRSARCWSRIKHLDIGIHTLATPKAQQGCLDDLKLLQTYLSSFQANLTSFKFRWIGKKGTIPIQRFAVSEGCNPGYKSNGLSTVPFSAARAKKNGPPSLHFGRLQRVELKNVTTKAQDVGAFASAHKRTLEELDLEDIELTDGSWDEALAPLTRLARSRVCEDHTAEIPIVLSPRLFPAPMERIEVVQRDSNGRRSLRISRWLSSRGKGRTPGAARKVKEGLLGCEEQLKKVFRGTVLPWR